MSKLLNLISASIFSTLLVLPLVTNAKEHPLVGISYPPLPREVHDLGGWIIDGPYVIDRASMRGQDLLLLGRRIGRDSQKNFRYEIVDVLVIPLMYETEEITGGASCFVDRKKAPNLIVIAKASETEFFTKARKAWKVEEGKFNEISVQGLRFECENFNYGF